MSTELNVKIVFNKLQTCNDTESAEYIKKLAQEINNDNIEDESILQIIDVLLFYGKKNDVHFNFTILKDLFDEVCCSKNGKRIIESIYLHLIQCLNSKYKIVRRNTIIILESLKQFVKIEDDILKKISTHLFDRENEVVKEAIIFLKDHQNLKIKKNDHIYNIFVNLLRHSPDPKIRLEILKHITLNENTIFYVAEEIIDEDLNVRRYFYENILPKIEYTKVKSEVIEFLIEKVFAEREFDHKKYLLEILADQFGILENAGAFLETLKDSSQKELLHHLVKNGLISYKSMPKSAIEAKILYECIVTMEENEVILHNTNTYINLIKNELKNDEFSTDYIVYLLKIIGNSQSDNSQDVIDVIFEVMTKKTDENVLDAVFSVFSQLILSSEETSAILLKFINQFCSIIPLITKYTAKYLANHTDICKGVLDTYKNTYYNNEDYLQALLYFLKSAYNQEFIDIIMKSNKIKYITDLYLINSKYVQLNLLESLIFDKLSDITIDIVEPMIKIMTHDGKNINNDFFLNIVQMYFEEIDDYSKQLISIYLNNSLCNNPELLLTNFERLFINIENKRMFTNQSLFWTKNCKNENTTQRLFYGICCMLLKNTFSKQDTSVLINTLHQIEISNLWNAEVTKKILYCSAQIVKRLENKTLMNDMIGNLMTIDDGEPISQFLVDEVKKNTDNQ